MTMPVTPSVRLILLVLFECVYLKEERAFSGAQRASVRQMSQ